MPEVYVDADACPVRDECIKVAQRHGLKLYMVSDGGIRPYQDPRIQLVVVAPGIDAADHWIVDNIGSNDIAITADISLAVGCIKSGAVVVKPSGEILKDDNIASVEANHGLMDSLREAGEITCGPRPFTKQDHSRFSSALEVAVQKALRRE